MLFAFETVVAMTFGMDEQIIEKLEQKDWTTTKMAGIAEVQAKRTEHQ